MRTGHLPLEFFVEKNGKRLMDEKLVRAMKSRISLKLPLAAVNKEKQRMSLGKRPDTLALGGPSNASTPKISTKQPLGLMRTCAK